MAKIFITGITGFLGSNIASFLADNGHDIVAIYREKSSRDLCANFIDKVQWILQDDTDDWVNTVINTVPEIVIHSAWLGVSHSERNNWECQFRNIDFLNKILFVTKEAKSNKFIGLGSQSEYGKYNGCISESQPLNAFEAYGCVKIICSEIVKQYCLLNDIDWFWLRLFSFFGKGESENWLIPSVVKNIIFNDHMDLTFGEQKYTYLYVKDLGLAINNIISTKGASGIYNISGRLLITLKYLVESIRDKINPLFKLNFGKLQYRANQPMHMQGDASKFVEEFGIFELSDFDKAMYETIEDLKMKFKNQINESV